MTKRLRKFYSGRALFALLLMVALPALAEVQTPAPFKYDSDRDRLSIDVTEVSLKGLLGVIGRNTGVEMRMDPAAERTVSARIESLPLEEGLKRITRGMSTIAIYDERPDKPGSAPMLIGYYVLPEGQYDNRRALPLAKLENEAVNFAGLRGKGPRNPNKLANPDPARQQRWQARLERLSPERRARLEQRVAERRAEKEQKAQRKAQKKAARKEKRKARQEARAAREAALQASDPAFYELRMQQRAAHAAAQGNGL